MRLPHIHITNIYYVLCLIIHAQLYDQCEVSQKRQPSWADLPEAGPPQGPIVMHLTLPSHRDFQDPSADGCCSQLQKQQFWSKDWWFEV
ncbi:hypothetical protein J1614_004794 [Plenodomus biglobosus]|nr:hypothetical protein J1614_004794 [Plenodomus biglobosus]